MSFLQLSLPCNSDTKLALRFEGRHDYLLYITNEGGCPLLLLEPRPSICGRDSSKGAEFITPASSSPPPRLHSAPFPRGTSVPHSHPRYFYCPYGPQQCYPPRSSP